MEAPRVYSLEEVNALVPSLTALVALQMERRSGIEERLKVLGEIIGELPRELVAKDDDPASVRTLKRELSARIAEYQAGWQPLEDMGGVLKDARTGLIDFYGRVEGRLVWLCWRYGEKEVRHYHALDEGFSARKEIKHSAKIRLLN